MPESQLHNCVYGSTLKAECPYTIKTGRICNKRHRDSTDRDDAELIAGGHVQHLKGYVDGIITVESLLQGIEFRRPRPFCGHPVPRKTAFLHKDGEVSKTYRFGGETWQSHKIPEGIRNLIMPLFELSRNMTEGALSPNVVLVQLYDGDGAIAWHADDEVNSMTRDVESGKVLPITSVSLGADAKFKLRTIAKPSPPKKRKSENVMLRNGDVLVMRQGTQELYEHCIPKGGINGIRVCLTFRHQS